VLVVRLCPVAGACGTCGLLPGSLNPYHSAEADTGCTEEER
jgi:hypothetical protein